MWVNYVNCENWLELSPGHKCMGIDISSVHNEIGRRILDDFHHELSIDRKSKDRTYITEDIESPMGQQVLLHILSKESRRGYVINDYAHCGKNCDKYLEEIADYCDVYIFLGRHYVPFLSGRPKSGVRFAESGEVVHDVESYLKEYERMGGMIEDIDTSFEDTTKATHANTFPRIRLGFHREIFDLVLDKRISIIQGDSVFGRRLLSTWCTESSMKEYTSKSYYPKEGNILDLMPKTLESVDNLEWMLKNNSSCLYIVTQEFLNRVWYDLGLEYFLHLVESYKAYFMFISRSKFLNFKNPSEVGYYVFDIDASGEKDIIRLKPVENQYTIRGYLDDLRLVHGVE